MGSLDFSIDLMALGSTQPPTEMTTRNLPVCKGRPAPKADNITVIRESIFQKMLEPRRLRTLCAFTICYRDSFTFTFYNPRSRSQLYLLQL
jgi:hypothetical protein